MTDKLENYYKNYNYNTRKPIYINEEDLRIDQLDRLITSNNFCMIPWIHMHAFPDGRAYPCCLGEMGHPIGNLKTHTLREVWNDEPYKLMRKNMLEDKPCKECTKCYEQEASGLVSMRESTNKNFGHHIALVDDTKEDGTYDDFKLRYYDIRFSNLCNFACRTCGSIFSSNWYKDEKAAGWNPQHPMVMYAGQNKDDMWTQMQEHIPHLEQIYWAGGEPLIMEEHWKVLDELVRREMFHVRLVYNTNFSTMKYKGRDVFEMWKLFDWIFELGELSFLSKEIVLEFTKNRFNESLKMIDAKPIFEIDKELLKESDWFNIEVDSETHTDFFHKTPTAYLKKAQSINAEDIF